MPDTEELLRADANRWRAKQGRPPDLDTAALDAVAGVKRRAATQRSVIVLSAAAIVLLAVGAVFVYAHPWRSRAASHGVAGSVQVHGKSIPYAGEVPWADPVADPTNPRVVYVFADGDRIHGRGSCSVDPPTERPVVKATNTKVSILVAGYAPKVPGDDCPGIGHAPQRVAVILPSPLDGRPLIDTIDGKAHPVLDPTTVPAVHHIPVACHADPVRWDEKTGTAIRAYTDHLKYGFRCLIWLQYGKTAAIEKLEGPTGAPANPIHVGSVDADVWKYTDTNNHGTTLQWTLSDGHRIRLTVNSSPRHPISDAEVLAIAESVR
jgi:hypothetical protein